MAIVATDVALGPGARCVARAFVDVSAADESISIFPILDSRFRHKESA